MAKRTRERYNYYYFLNNKIMSPVDCDRIPHTHIHAHIHTDTHYVMPRITPIPKMDMKTDNKENSQPISLMNTDTNIFL